LVSVHCHEFGGAILLSAGSRAELEETAEFVTRFAHQAIDAGADIFVGHGSHFPMGVEIYHGKPIFYSVGNFVFQNETVGFFPADAYDRFDLDLRATPSDFLDARTAGGKKGHPAEPAYWENMFAVCEFSSSKLKEIKIIRLTKASAAQDRSGAGRSWPKAKWRIACLSELSGCRSATAPKSPFATE
jgi:poly-gamma-glutamate synthesis protein (capsule biosynthesis protein)